MSETVTLNGHPDEPCYNHPYNEAEINLSRVEGRKYRWGASPAPLPCLPVWEVH